MITESCPACGSQSLLFGKVEELIGYAQRGILVCGDCGYWRLVDLERQEPKILEKESK